MRQRTDARIRAPEHGALPAMGERLSAGEVCIRDVVIVQRSTGLSEAAHLLRGEHVGCLVVVDQAAGLRQVSGGCSLV